MNKIDEVLALWLSKPEFKDQFKKNPKDALEEEGLELSEEDFKLVQTSIKRQEDHDSGSSENEELVKRISK